jgi:hypothetical protein
VLHQSLIMSGQVDAFGRAANEHNLGRVGGVDKTSDRLARSRQVIRSTTG